MQRLPSTRWERTSSPHNTALEVRRPAGSMYRRLKVLIKVLCTLNHNSGTAITQLATVILQVPKDCRKTIQLCTAEILTAEAQSSVQRLWYSRQRKSRAHILWSPHTQDWWCTRMPLQLSGPRNSSRFSLQKCQHSGDLAQSEILRCQEDLFVVQEYRKSQEKNIHVHKIAQAYNLSEETLSAQTSWDISLSWMTLHVRIKKIHPFQMFSFYTILHSKIWQWPRWDLDNRAASGNQWQSRIQPSSHCVSAEKGDGKEKRRAVVQTIRNYTNEKTSFENWFANAWNYVLLKFYQAKYLRGTKKFLPASKQAWEKSRANMQHMGIAKTRSFQFGCINMESVCVNIHLWSLMFKNSKTVKMFSNKKRGMEPVTKLTDYY